MKERKKLYMCPVSTCTEIELESPICCCSDKSGNTVEAHTINTDFTDANNFTEVENPWD